MDLHGDWNRNSDYSIDINLQLIPEETFTLFEKPDC